MDNWDRRTRTTITPAVRKAIEEEALKDPKAPAWRLVQVVRSRLDRMDIEDSLPVERSIQKIAKAVRDKPGPPASDVDIWSPRVSGRDTPAEALADLLMVWRISKAKDVRFTITKARWASNLRYAIRASSIGPITWSEAEELLYWSELYAGREYAGEVTGKWINTSDLDAELAYQPWVSPLHRWQYEQAVKLGAAPPSGREDGWNLSDGFYDVAGDLMKKVDDESGTTEAESYPEARAVVTFWLRAISSKIQRWNAAYWDDLWGEDGKSWWEMGKHLTEEVVAKARQLEQHIPAPSEPGDDGDVVWEPSETLKDVGLLEAG